MGPARWYALTWLGVGWGLGLGLGLGRELGLAVWVRVRGLEDWVSA